MAKVNRPCRPIGTRSNISGCGNWVNEGDKIERVTTEKVNTRSGTCRETEGRGPAWEGVDDPSPPERLTKTGNKSPSSPKLKIKRG